ncbi:MAG: hypothetical protein HY558_00310 [Euryarchaeota archaeon]|nr:hypothetical protein [Euryarchaeota archaeon]
MDEIERVRRDFKPDKVRVLFVGESPPAMGGFFYKVDRLTRFTREAFYKVYGDEVGCGKQFLDFFKAQG